MSINAEITLKRLVHEISVWATAHSMIEAFGYGKYLETFASDEARKYPVFVVNCPNYTQDQWYFNYNLELICLEWVFDDRGNRVPAASDTAKIISDFENTIRESNRWQSFSRIDGNFNGRKVDEFGGDKADGWITTFILKVKKTSGICNLQELLPTYDFENQTPSLTCAPVSIYENDILIQSVPSGGEFRYNTSVLNTSSIYKTGATSSYWVNDDGMLEQGRGVDFYTLDFTNKFDNTDRFTDDLGTQIYTSGVVLDWSTYDQVNETVRAFSQSPLASAFVKTHLTNAPYTLSSYNDWQLFNYKQMVNLFDLSITRNYLNYSPFNHDVDSTPNRVWTSTLESGGVGMFYSGVSVSIGGVSAGYVTFITRLYTLTELGI